MCDIRKGRRRLSDKLIIKMSGELSVDNGRYLIAARVAYSYEAEERLAWKRVLKKHCQAIAQENLAKEHVDTSVYDLELDKDLIN